MKILSKQNIMTAVLGAVTGLINGALGAGGGMIAVPALGKLGLEKKQSHANAVAVILPLTLLSAALYIGGGRVTVADALPFIPGGLAGAVAGTFLMKKISPVWLSRIFGAFMIFAGVRMILK